MSIYSLGIDVGSTTVKTVIINDKKDIIYSEYQRHFSKVRDAVKEQLEIIAEKFPEDTFRVCMTGSAGLGLATGAEIPFVQEVNSAFIAVKERFPDVDAVIELGGEDAKIIFMTGGVEQRMNGSCAGGTGAFIDQMATLLAVTVPEMDKMALEATKVYPIASRWAEIFETHRKIVGTSSKPKTRKQIFKWLQNPHSDSAEYKMWGNGVALPNVVYVLTGIVYYTQNKGV